MSPEEIAEFEKNPNLDAIVRVRIYDDEGKIAGFNPKSFSHYRNMVQRVVDRHVGRRSNLHEQS